MLTQCCGLLSDRDDDELIVRCLQAALRGVPLRFANRELESGADGDLRRLHFIVRYNF